MKKPPYKYKGREKQYMKEYREANKLKLKAYCKKYNRAYYLAHKGKKEKNET